MNRSCKLCCTVKISHVAALGHITVNRIHNGKVKVFIGKFLHSFHTIRMVQFRLLVHSDFHLLWSRFSASCVSTSTNVYYFLFSFGFILCHFTGKTAHLFIFHPGIIPLPEVLNREDPSGLFPWFPLKYSPKICQV